MHLRMHQAPSMSAVSIALRRALSDLSQPVRAPGETAKELADCKVPVPEACPLLDRYALGEVAWFIDVASQLDGEVVGEQL